MCCVVITGNVCILRCVISFICRSLSLQVISKEEYQKWLHSYTQAQLSVMNKEDLLSESVRGIERQLELLGG